MKALRIIGLIITKLGLSIGVMCFILSFALDGVVSSGVTSVLVSNPAIGEVLNEAGIESEKVQEVIESEEVQGLIDKYVEPVLEGNVDVSDVDIGHDLLELIRENQEEIETIVGEEIPMEQIEGYLQSDEMKQFTETYKDTVEQVQENVPVEVKESVNSVRYFFTDEFRYIVLGVSVLCLILVGLLQWSLYVWIRTLGNTLTWCGVLVGAFVGLGSILVSGMASFMGTGMKIDLSNGLYSALISVVSGILCLIIYAVIKKNVGKKSDIDEVSEISN